MGACVRKLETHGTFNSGSSCTDSLVCQRDSIVNSCLDTASASECHASDGVTVERSCVGFPSEASLTKTRTSTYYPGLSCCVVQGLPNQRTLTCQHTIFEGCPGGNAIVNAYSGDGAVVNQVLYGVCVNSLAGCNSVRCCCGSQCKLSPGLNCDALNDASCIQAPGVNSWLSGSNAVLYECAPCLNPPPGNYACSETLCGGTGCCLCDRCCDMPSQTCLDKGGKVMTGSCSTQATKDACKAANWPPKCKGGVWTIGIRPTEHTAKPGRMSIVSKLTHKNIDRASGQTECRKVYGWLQRNATQGVMEGRICNQSNQRCATATKKSPIMKLVRNATSGVMQWEGKYRTPCPEQADFLSTCSTTVGCAA